MKKYKSGIHYGEDRRKKVIDTSFSMTKTLHCEDEETRDIMVDKLERLKSENFNRVSIPQFSYRVDGNIVIYDVEYIKGYQVATFIPQFAEIIKEDVRDRTSPWTFTDYHMVNFVIEYKTNQLYAVDFQSYCLADYEWRMERWNTCLKKDKERVQIIMSGGWYTPRGW
jgi:hypothetical protein